MPESCNKKRDLSINYSSGMVSPGLPIIVPSRQCREKDIKPATLEVRM